MILFDIYVYSTFYSIGIWNVSYTCWIGTLVFLLPFTSPLHSSGILFRFLKHLLLTLFLPSTLPFRRCFCILRPPPCPFHLSYGIYFSIFEVFFVYIKASCSAKLHNINFNWFEWARWKLKWEMFTRNWRNKHIWCAFHSNGSYN